MSASAMIELRDVRFGYDNRNVLDLPSFSVAPGSTVLLRGASGSGKSTLLGLLAGVLLPSSGTVTVAGQALHSLRSAARDGFRADHLGVIFQQFNLLPFLSVRDNIAMGLRFSRQRAKRVNGPLETEIMRLMQALQLDPGLLQRKAGTLSVGQQQRVAAARALIGAPQVLLADEPTSALDSGAGQAFLELMAAQCRAVGATAVVVSHDERLDPLFDQVVLLERMNQAETAHA
jgi:putative ABC transport system ATP-binding protein